jgi:putative membrane protein insertion efficiency factor
MARQLIVICVHVYQIVFRPLLPPSCRFYPSCSDYLVQAVRRLGPWKGLRLGLRRIARCHPWNPGGYDPLDAAARGPDHTPPAPRPSP